MKKLKLLILFIIAISLFILIGCSDNKSALTSDQIKILNSSYEKLNEEQRNSISLIVADMNLDDWDTYGDKLKQIYVDQMVSDLNKAGSTNSEENKKTGENLFEQDKKDAINKLKGIKNNDNKTKTTELDISILKKAYKDFSAEERTKFAEIDEKYESLSDNDKESIKADYERLKKEQSIVIEQWKEESLKRPVSGEATDLGAGTFTGGKDVQAGLYDVTPVEGQGNFTIKSKNGYLNVNEILGENMGMGVSKVRVKISEGDEIQLQSVNKVHFEPVTSPFVTAKQVTQMHSGTWVVGEDIVKGRYNAVPASGDGNFVVYGKSGLPKTNEILGDSGVKQVTVNLNDGDIIMISNLNQVTLTPTN